MPQKLKPEASRLPGRKLTIDEQSIRDMINTPIKDVVDTEASGPMVVGRPAFGGQPLIVGSELAKYYNKFRQLAPNLDARVKRIQYGPGSVAINALQGNNGKYYDPERFGISTMLGVTNPMSGEININPSLGSPSFLRHNNMTSMYGDDPPDQVLLHELTHAAGYYGETEPRNMEQIWRKMMFDSGVYK